MIDKRDIKFFTVIAILYAVAVASLWFKAGAWGFIIVPTIVGAIVGATNLISKWIDK